MFSSCARPGGHAQEESNQFKSRSFSHTRGRGSKNPRGFASFDLDSAHHRAGATPRPASTPATAEVPLRCMPTTHSGGRTWPLTVVTPSCQTDRVLRRNQLARLRRPMPRRRGRASTEFAASPYRVEASRGSGERRDACLGTWNFATNRLRGSTEDSRPCGGVPCPNAKRQHFSRHGPARRPVGVVGRGRRPPGQRRSRFVAPRPGRTRPN